MSSRKDIPTESAGPTRRDFMKTVGGVAAVSMVAGRIPSVLAKEKPIKIGAAISLTGKYARSGQEQYKGYQLWVKHVNELGYSYGKADLPNTGKPGLMGRPVELIVLDDRSDPTTGVRLYNELIYGRKVDLLLGPYSSAVTQAVAPIIENAQIPTPNPMASSTAIWDGRGLSWQVQVQPPGSRRLPGITHVASEHGDEKIALIYEDSAFPRNAAGALMERARADGMKIVADIPYPTKLTNWTPIVQKAMASGATVLAGGGYLPDAIGITRATRSLGYTPNILSLLVGVALPDYIETLDEAALTATGDADWTPDVSWPGAQKYVEAYKQAYGGIPEYHSAGGYGAAQILEQSVRQAGSFTDLQSVRDEMYALKTLTVFNSYEVAPLSSPDSGLQLAANRVMLQVQQTDAGLRNAVVYPSDAANSKWIYPFQSVYQ